MPTYTMTGPGGQTFQLTAGDDVPQEKVEAELRRRIGAYIKENEGSAASATPQPAPAQDTSVPKLPGDDITDRQRLFQAQAQAQREAERGFFGRAYDTLMGNELPVPEAYTPQELAARQKEIRAEQEKLKAQAEAYDKMALQASKEYQNPNAPDRSVAYMSRAQAARDQAKALEAEYDSITKTGLKVPEAQTTRETIGAIPREFFGGLASIPGGLVQLAGTGLEAAGFDAEGITETGRGMREGAREAAEDVFGAPGEALQYDAVSQFAADVGGGVGSIGTFLVPGAVAKVGGVGKGLTAAERAAEIARVARPYEYGLGTAQGLEQGIRDVEAYEARTGEDVSAGKKLASYLLNAGLGATEVGVASRIFERIPVAQRGAAADAVADIVRRGTAGRVNPTAIAEAVGRTLTNIESRALGRVAVRGLEEAGQEGGVQFGTNLIAKGLYDPNRDLTEGVGYNALIGGVVGGGLRGTVEGVSALRAAKAQANPQTDFENSPEVENEYLRLVATEAQALMAADPSLTQRQAFNAVVTNKNVGKLYQTAIENVLFGAQGGAGGTDTGMDVSGGTGAGTTTDFEPEPSVPGTGELGATDTGGVERPLSGVSPAVTGEGEGTAPLVAPVVEPKAKDVKAMVPTIEQAFADAALDFEDTYGIKKLNAEQKKQAARIVLQSPEVDPYDAITSVIERGIALRGEQAPAQKGKAPSKAATELGITPGTALDEELAARDEAVSQELIAPGTQATPTVDETLTEEKLAPVADERELEELGKKWEEAEDLYNRVYRSEEQTPEGMSEKETEMFFRGHDKAWDDSQRAAANYFRAKGDTKQLKFYLGQISNRTTDEQVELNNLVNSAANDQFGGPLEFDPNNPDDVEQFNRMMRPSRPGEVQPKTVSDFTQGTGETPQVSVGQDLEGAAIGPRPENQRAEAPEAPMAIQQMPGKRTLKDYRLQGWNAAEAGWSIDDDPYYASSPASDAWRKGFRSSDKVAPATQRPGTTAAAPTKAPAKKAPTEKAAPKKAEPKTYKLTPYKDVAVAINFADNGQYDMQAGEQNADWLSKDLIQRGFDKDLASQGAGDAFNVQLRRVENENGDILTALTVTVRGVDAVSGNRGNTASATAWIKNAGNVDYANAIDALHQLALKVADPQNAAGLRSRDAAPVARMNKLGDRIAKYISSLGGKGFTEQTGVKSGGARLVSPDGKYQTNSVEEAAAALESGQFDEDGHISIFVGDSTFGQTGVEPLTGEAEGEFLDLVDGPRSTDIAALAENLPEARRVHVRAQLDKIMAQYQKDGDVERMMRSLEGLREEVDNRIYRNTVMRARDRVRGFERAMEVIYRAERNGQLTPEAAGLIRWLLEQNPAIAEELAISIREGANQKAAGQYSPAARLATIFASNANEGTAVHEVLHHTERLMPENVREGIRAAWRKRIDDLMALAEKTNNQDMREVLGTIVQAYYGDAQAQQALKEAFEAGTIPYSVYHLSNPSEFWAVNATDLVGKRAKRAGWVGAARTWLSDFIETVKDLFGFTNNNAIIKGLKSVLEAESGAVSGKMLSEAAQYNAPSGKKPKGGTQPEVVSNGKVVTLTEAQKRTALAKAQAVRAKANRIQKRIARTNDTADVIGDGIELAKLVRGDPENIALLKGLYDTFDIGKWKLILPTLSTEDIFRILKGRIDGLTEADRIIRKDVVKFETKEYLELADQLEEVANFLKKYPKAAQALSDLEFASVAFQVDPSLAETPEAYANKIDKKMKELKAELAKTSAGDTKKVNSLKSQISKRLNEIKSVYEGVPSGDERVYGWRDLARPELGGNKGKQIFKLIRDAHRRDLEAKYNGLRSRLMETKSGEKLAEALEKLEKAFKPALDQVIYFPAMRYGPYYARVGSGASSVFKMFETETKRNQFIRVMKARAKTAAKPEDFEVTEVGSTEDLRNQFREKGGPLNDVLDLFEDNPKDISALRNQVFDIWLQTLSSGDMRKHMAPRKARAGYSTDILKNFANFRRSSINDIKRSTYGYKLRTQLSSARDSVAGMPDQLKMEEFIKEIELRTMAELMPPNRENGFWNAMVRLGNKAAFYQYLANPKTAIIQLTQLHIVALPMLAEKYGTAGATAALAKYGFSALGGFAASPLTSVKNEDGSWTFNWEQPNLMNNPVTGIKEDSDPQLYEVLSEGWQEGSDLNLWMDTFANDIGGYGNLDPQQRTALQDLMRGRVDRAAMRGTTFALEAMGSLMHQMERVNREATYMAALELAYRKRIDAGKDHAVAKHEAIQEAVELTLEATFDFSSYNKPRVLTTPLGRLSGQFYTYPYMMSSLLVRNLYTAIKFGKLEPGERMAAAKIATASLINISLYAGIRGVPLYGIFAVIGKLLAWLFDDDDEEGGLSYVDKDGNIKATYDFDWWFRNVWTQEFFGPKGTVASMLDLDDDTAAFLATAADKGVISAITDVDLANSVALDFMFFLPKEPRSEQPEDQIRELVFNIASGASGGTLMDYIRAGKDYANGYTQRALERLPKLYGNIAKANRFAEEGQLNYDRELVGMDADFWTTPKAILQALGFNSTEADIVQQQNYEAKAIQKDVKQARDGVFARIRKLALDAHQYGNTEEVKAERAEVMRAWREYNERFPTDPISYDSLYKSQVEAVDKAKRSVATRGVALDEKGEKTPYLRGIHRERIRRAEEREAED